MAETRRQFDAQFRAGAVRIVRETGKPIADVARDLGINPGTLANWVKRDRETSKPAGGALAESERDELLRLRREAAELAMERDVLKRSVVLWVKEATKTSHAVICQAAVVGDAVEAGLNALCSS